MSPKEKIEIVEAIKNSHQAIYQSFHDLFDNSVRGFSEQLGMFEEANKEQHKEIMRRLNITNGKVTILEKETGFFRWCARNPKLAAILCIILLSGIITLGVVFGMDKLIGMVK